CQLSNVGSMRTSFTLSRIRRRYKMAPYERRMLMSKRSGDKISRRKFVKLTGGAAAAAAGLTTGFLFPQRALAQQKTLKIVQWSHFVPGYDKWFDNTFTKEWGAKNNTNVIVDHIAINEINARAAAEVAAKKGHDLFMFLAPPAAYEKQEEIVAFLCCDFGSGAGVDL